MKITILNSIVYEVLLSLSLFKRQTHLKYLGITKDWLEKTKEQLSADLKKDLEELEDLQFEDLSVHLIERCPYKDVHGYCTWLEGMPLGELYELLSPYVDEKRPMPPNLEQRKERHVSLLSKWYKEYFSKIEAEVSPILQAEIRKINLDDMSDSPYSKIEEATKGFAIEHLGCREAILVPTWHFRPLSLIDIFNDKAVLTFPCSMGEKAEALLITKALAEEKRLDILWHMKEDEKTFTDLVNIMGMSKGNIHHHLLLLRSAGLLKIIPTKQDHFLYKFRASRVDDLSNLLNKMD